MPSLDGYIFLGYDPDTGNPTYYPSLPDPTEAWYPTTNNSYVSTTEDFPSVTVADSEGTLNYRVPVFSSAVLGHLAIALQPFIYDWANTKIVEAGYPALNGKTYLTVGTDQFRLSMAYNVSLDRYDLIAFQTTVALSQGETVSTYTASQAIFLGTLPAPNQFPAARFVL